MYSESCFMFVEGQYVGPCGLLFKSLDILYISSYFLEAIGMM